MSAGLRIGVAGATGVLGRELLTVLDGDALPIAEMRLFAGDRSLGEDGEFRGEVLPVEVGVESLAGLDAVVLCTPVGVALDLVRTALRSEVPCLDCSGALVGSDEVPLSIANLGADDRLGAAPLITAPPGPALLWAAVLAALQREAGLRRVIGTVLQSASAAGRAGIETLSQQTVALLNQRPMPEPAEPVGPAAFDCVAHPVADAGDKEGAAPAELLLAQVLGRLLGPDVHVAPTCVHVPTFAGQGGALTIEAERPLPPERAVAVLETTPGIDVWPDGPPSTRDAVGRDEVLVGRVRSDASIGTAGTGLSLWLAGDPVRLAAANAVKLLHARFPEV